VLLVHDIRDIADDIVRVAIIFGVRLDLLRPHLQLANVLSSVLAFTLAVLHADVNFCIFDDDVLTHLVCLREVIMGLTQAWIVLSA
jgi:hypothetical protein